MSTMNAVRLHAPGPPEVLRFEEVERPVAGPGEALVQVAAVGVNYADAAARSGTYPAGPLPEVLGFEAAGTVVAVGPGVDGDLVGRRVVAMAPRAYAEYLVADAAVLVPVPGTMTWTQAAAFAAQGLTAHGMLHAARVGAGDTVLVLAAAGGVGTLAVQLARRLGASRVIGAASTPEKRALAARLGADTTVDYTAAGWTDDVLAQLDGGTVDVVLDLVGGTMTNAVLPLLTPATGRVVLGGLSGGLPQVDASALIGRGVAAIGYTNPVWLARPEFAATALPTLLDGLADGSLEVVVGGTHPLRDAAVAHRELEQRRTVGKLVLLTGPGAGESRP